MTEHSKTEPLKSSGLAGILRSPTGMAVCMVVAGLGLALAFEHRVHLLASLPLLLPLAICVGMHVFMHRGHGGGKGQ
jgi:hypothetical protein